MLLNDGTCRQSCLDCTGICPHKPSCPKKDTSKISGHHNGRIIDPGSQKYIQHRPSGCSGWFSVITAAGGFPVHPYGIYIAVMTCIPVFFFHFFDKGKGLFFCFHRTDGCDETGFFFHKFAFAAFVYGFIMFQHGLRLRYLYPTLCFRQSFLYCIIIIFIAQCIRYHEL